MDPFARTYPYCGEWARDRASWPRRRVGLLRRVDSTAQTTLCETEPTRSIIARLWEAGAMGASLADVPPLLVQMLDEFGMLLEMGAPPLLSDSGRRAWTALHRRRGIALEPFGARSASLAAPIDAPRPARRLLDDPVARISPERVVRRLEEDERLVRALRAARVESEVSPLRIRIRNGSAAERRDWTVALLKLESLGLLDRRFALTDHGRAVATTMRAPGDSRP